MSVTILGVSSRRPRHGRRLHDGNAAVIDPSGTMSAIAEERLSREKHGDGYARAATTLLGRRSVDGLVVGFASALDAAWKPEQVSSDVRAQLGYEPRRIEVIDHHRAHAAAGVFSSPFADGLCLVIDARGNIVDGTWQCETLYRFSTCAGGRRHLEQLARQPASRGVGWGQLWRAATKLAGFPSYHDASKLMALAGMGKARSLTPLWDVADAGVAEWLLRQLEHERPVESLALALDTLRGAAMTPALRQGWYDRGDGLRSADPSDLAEVLRLATTVQSAFEHGLDRWLDEQDPAAALVISGGVAANSVAMGRVARSGRPVHVPTAPGDDGIGFGLAASVRERELDPPSPATASPFLGPDRSVVTASLRRKLLSRGWSTRPPTVETVAELLRKGALILRATGRSEYGPRALGHRSILALPTGDGARHVLARVRRLKRREPFQPFGATLSPRSAKVLELPPSPYMSFAGAIDTDRLPRGGVIDSLLHEDLTLRYSIVNPRWDEELDGLLTELDRHEEPGGVLNTSLNLRGHPLVETDEDLDELLEVSGTYEQSNVGVWGEDVLLAIA